MFSPLKDKELKKCCSGLKFNAQKVELIKKAVFFYVTIFLLTRVIKFNLQTGQSKYNYKYTLECLPNSIHFKYGVSHGLVLISLPFLIHSTHFPKLKKVKPVIHMDDNSIPNIWINSKESETHISANTTLRIKQYTH
jgi:hypothetical protein